MADRQEPFIYLFFKRMHTLVSFLWNSALQSTLGKLPPIPLELKSITNLGVCLSLGDFLGNLSAWTRGYNTYPFSPPLPDFLPMFRHREEAKLAGRGRECLMSMECMDASAR